MKGFKQSAKMSHGGHYCWGGKVMKKAEGGGVLRGLALDSKPTRPSRPLGMSSGAPMSPPPRTPFRDIAIPSGPGRLRPPMPVMPRPTTPTPPPKPALTGSSMRMNKAQGGKVMAGTDSDGRTHRKIEKGMGYSDGGMAKGGNWIQSAIKKPGALKKSLGVPMDKPIPAKKLEKASKAPGKMGQRARLAMTLKGMK